ncbi:MAG TPA: M28 family metallopeptidase [Terriglobales bacterium]|nr:M28 family metallopeptidase [Terriglobales bacterium]
MHDVDDGHIKADIRFLSSNLLEGRGTGARGGDLAAHFIADQFEQAGLKPLGANGGFLQDVPMLGVTTMPESTLAITTPKETMDLKQWDDCVIMDDTGKPANDVASDLLFVGYGIRAPEYHWDDYAGVDVKGKVLLMLVNEPPSEDPSFFKGKALTYYGRWTYKYEEAARMGAAGVILIHKTDMASYGWDVVRNSWSGERSYLRDDQNPKLALAAWVQLDVARKMLADAGKDIDQLIRSAQQRGFKPVPLSLKVQAHIVSKTRPFDAYNVIGEVVGSNAELKDQAVIVTAHYDHLGIRPDMKGDNIYNGALDNASGTAILMEMARAASGAAQKPKRSIIFAAVTGEEQGLLGSEYLGQHPPIPVGNISLNVNFDSIPPLGIPKEVSADGYDRTNFTQAFQKTAADFGMTIQPPAHPESGGYYRSDHFSFARVGVPAFSVNTGARFEGHPEDWVKEQQKKDSANYHEPSDEFQEDGDYRTDGVMARFGLALAWQAADQSQLVEWRPGDEFERARKAESGGK